LLSFLNEKRGLRGEGGQPARHSGENRNKCHSVISDIVIILLSSFSVHGSPVAPLLSVIPAMTVRKPSVIAPQIVIPPLSVDRKIDLGYSVSRSGQPGAGSRLPL